MMRTNPKLDLVNINVCTIFGQILSILSQDIEKKLNSGIKTRAILNSVTNLRKMMHNKCNANLDLVNINVNTKFGQTLSVLFQDVEREKSGIKQRQ